MEKILFIYHFPLGEYASLVEGYELVRPEAPLEKFRSFELLEKVKDASALVTSMSYRCTKELLEAGPKLKAVGTVSVGFNHVDVETATKNAIAVIHSPQSVIDPTAELTIALMMDCCRSITRYDRELRANLRWKDTLLQERDMVITGKKLGIIGFGRIGKSVAKKAQALGMQILYYNTTRASAEVEQEYKASYRPVEALLAEADVVTLHMPYSQKSHHFMNDARLALMKSTAYLINAARGSVVDEQALVRALRNGTIRGAGLDVHENEPAISADIAALDNVVLTPHVGTNIAEVRMHMLGETLSGIVAVLRGEKPENQVNELPAV